MQDRPWDYMYVKSMPTGEYIYTIRGHLANYNDFVEFVIPTNDEENFHKAVQHFVMNDKELKTEIIENREDKNMSMNFMNKFDFGTCDKESYRISPYGLAIRNSTGNWVSYDTKSGKVIEVDIFNFGSGKYFFKMPVAIKDIAIGDIVIHNGRPVFVTEIAGTNISVVDPFVSEAKTVIPVRNMYGFDFVTKIICPFSSMFSDAGANVDQPFGNILPFMLMSEGSDIDPMMVAMLAGGGTFDVSNPMMMYALCASGDKSSSALPLVLMMSQMAPKK